MKHTPEPWYVAHHQFFYAAGHLLVGQTACPPALSDDPVATQAINADRIVACVNACAGISEESLADDCWNKMRDDRNRLAALNAEFLSELSEYRAIRDRLAAQDKAGTLPDDYSIYIGLLENRLSEQRNLNSVMEQQLDELLAELNYLMGQFDGEIWQCRICGAEEETSTMDSARHLREFLQAIAKAGAQP